MRKWSFCIKIILIWINILSIGAAKEDICEKCLKIEDCGMFVSMTKEEQQKWFDVASCDGSQSRIKIGHFSFSSIPKGDYVCCPNNSLWGTDILNLKNNIISFKTIQSQIKPRKNSRLTIRINTHEKFNFSGDVKYLNPNVQHGHNLAPGQGSYIVRRRQNGISNQHIYNNQQYPNIVEVNHAPNYTNSENGNSNPINMETQCAVPTALLPDPGTGCCGQDMFDFDPITDLQSILNETTKQNKNWSGLPSLFYPSNGQRMKRFAENETILEEDFSIDLRITGGTDIDLDQFPWTVHLKITFAYGNGSTMVFNCGGSLISPKYVLTAGHCIYIKSATVSQLRVTLAEYDKRTSPKDCISNLREKDRCIDNVVMYVERIIPYNDDDDFYVNNDIALLRLRGYAPYTRFIRPICLPPININIDDFDTLPLAVSGWGRNGLHISNIKQSTVVRLVPPLKCKNTYWYLSAKQLCAVGRNRENTCSGDSGGPLMMLYRGSYYVVGIVSGKKKGFSCSSGIPSIYTNVYDYVPWIKRNISN